MVQFPWTPIQTLTIRDKLRQPGNQQIRTERYCGSDTYSHPTRGLLMLPVRRFCWASSPDSWAATTACISRCTRAHHCHCFHQRGSQFRQTPGDCCHAEQLSSQTNIHLKTLKGPCKFELFFWQNLQINSVYLTLTPALWACSLLSGSAASSLWQSGNAKAPWTVDNPHSLGLLTHHSQGCNHQTHTGLSCRQRNGGHCEQGEYGDLRSGTKIL